MNDLRIEGMNMPNESNNAIVVMIRHAQSEWNRAGRFTGWANPSLTDAGCEEAACAGACIAAAGFRFGHVYSSRLRRAYDTARIILEQTGQDGLPIVEDWRLNERHYGALQGMNKMEMAVRVGEDQVWRWRRGYQDAPPQMACNDPTHPSHEPYWSDIDIELLPSGESLAATRQRVTAFWDEHIVPELNADSPLLISSHGNTLRALLMALDDMSIDEVEAFEIPTGLPIVYTFSPDGKPIGWRYLESATPQAA